MAIIDKTDPHPETQLQQCQENPEAGHPDKMEYPEHYTDPKKETEISFLTNVLVRLYGYDFGALKGHLTKIVVLKAELVPDEKERYQCLRYLLGALDGYSKEDYLQILNLIDSMAASKGGGQP